MVDAVISGARALVRERRHATRLSGAFGVLVILTYGLIVLGALVRAHGAGLACPDWPLCFGEWLPTLDLRVGFEYAHRLMAGSLSLAFALCALVTLRSRVARRATGRLLGLAAGLLAIQVLLGALTVWHRLAAWTVTCHLVVGNAFAVTLFWVALALREVGRPVPTAATPRAVRAWVTAAAALLVLQVALGGLVSSRYAGLACPDWPACSGGVWFPSWRGVVGLHLLHRMNGYALLLVLLAAAWRARNHPVLRSTATLACALGIAQVAVGVFNVRLGLPVEVTGLHSALAAALVLTLSLAVRTAWLRPAARC